MLGRTAPLVMYTPTRCIPKRCTTTRYTTTRCTTTRCTATNYLVAPASQAHVPEMIVVKLAAAMGLKHGVRIL